MKFHPLIDVGVYSLIDILFLISGNEKKIKIINEDYKKLLRSNSYFLRRATIKKISIKKIIIKRFEKKIIEVIRVIYL